MNVVPDLLTEDERRIVALLSRTLAGNDKYADDRFPLGEDTWDLVLLTAITTAREKATV
jgi:hypothetical protein